MFRFSAVGILLSVFTLANANADLISVSDLSEFCRTHRPNQRVYPVQDKLVNGRLPFDAGLAQKEIMLTFDDGPNLVDLPLILDTLDACNIKVHFFFVGRSARRAGELHSPLIQRVLSGGHQVGSHSMTHASGMTLGNMIDRAGGSTARVRREIVDAHNVVMDVFGTNTPFFRFPYGNGSRSATANDYLESVGLVNFFWNASTGDSDPAHPRGAEAVYHRSKQQIAYQEERGHGVLLLAHERGGTPAMLATLLRDLIQEGYTFVTFLP